jgi:muramidase (phage lysozyme)
VWLLNKYGLLIAIILIAVVIWLWAYFLKNRIVKATTNNNVKAFLKMIRFAEGTAGPNGYRTKFGGKLFDTDNGWQHPNDCVPFFDKRTQKTNCSTAAGAYQFLFRTWMSVKTRLDLSDFSPDNQDKAAIYLIEKRGALDDVIAGNFPEAVAKVAKEWASMPGAGYMQPEKKLAELVKVYQDNGGQLA